MSNDVLPKAIAVPVTVAEHRQDEQLDGAERSQRRRVPGHGMIKMSTSMDSGDCKSVGGGGD
jgi:hypothetical protein